MKAIINANLYDFYEYHEDSYILFDRIIVKTGPMKEFDAGMADEIIDIENGFLLPGLVIGHTHLYGAFMRGCSIPQVHSVSFREQLEQLYWKVDGGLDNETSYYSAKTLAMDHIRCGVTTIFDHHASGTEIIGSLEAVKKAWTDETGLRGIYCFETSDRFNVEECIRENVEFYEKGSDDMHAAMFGMHASMSICDKTLDQVAEAARGIPVHVHVGESLEDEEECQALYKKRIVERLVDAGLAVPGSIFAHCVNINNREAALMSERGCMAALNITSNLNTGNGMPDYRLFERYRIKAMLGNDSLGSNFAYDIRNSMFGMHLRTKNPWWFDYGRLLECVRNSYDAASAALGVKLGRLKEGYQADFASVDYTAPTPVNQNNAWGHVLDGIFNSYHPKNLWCAGQQKMSGYQVLFDEEEICRQAMKSAAALWKRIGC